MAALRNLERIGHMRKQFEHVGVVGRTRFLKSIEPLPSRRRLLRRVPSARNEGPEGSGKRRVEGLHAENDAQVFRGAELETGIVHDQVARSTPDQHVSISELPKVFAEHPEALHHGALPIICSRAASTRSSSVSLKERYKDNRSTHPPSLKSEGG